jgi:hypothetical protein
MEKVGLNLPSVFQHLLAKNQTLHMLNHPKCTRNIQSRELRERIEYMDWEQTYIDVRETKSTPLLTEEQ